MIKQNFLWLCAIILSIHTIFGDTATSIVTPTYIIKQVDLPYTIATSGVYWLGEDIASGNPAITINASNVTFDLKGFAMSAGTTGIVVSSGINDIIIRNGSIEQFSQSGILATNNRRLNLNNLIVSNCVVNGATITSCTGLSISKCTFTQCATTTNISDSPIIVAIASSSGVTIQDCALTSSGSASFPVGQTLVGLNLDSNTSVVCSNVNISNNTASGQNFFGIYAQSNTHASFANCSVNNNTAGTLYAALTGAQSAIGLNNSLSVQFLNCVFSDNTATVDLHGVYAKGNCIVRDCYFENNSVSADSCKIIDFVNTNNLATQCIAIGNAASPATTNSFIYCLDGTSVRNAFVGCISSNNTATMAYYLRGGVGTTPTICVVQDCVSNADSNIGFGFDGGTTSFSALLRCIAVGTPTPYSNFAAGSQNNAATLGDINGSLVNCWSNVSVS